MRMRLAFCFFAIALFVSISAVSASLRPSGADGRSSVKAGSVYGRNSINAGSYRSPGRLHKAVVAKSSGAIEIADYGSFKLLAMDESALASAEEKQSERLRSGGAEEQRSGDDGVSISSAPQRLGSSASLAGSSASLAVRDDLNVLLLRSGAIDTTDDETTGTFVGMGRSAASYGLQASASRGIETSESNKSTGGTELRLVQFVGPVKRAWLEQLEASGFETIAYVPNNGYLVRGDSNARARLMSSTQSAEARGEGFVQWEGPFLEEHKIHPALSEAMAAATGEVTVAVQLALGNGERNARENAEVKQARKLASRVLLDSYGARRFAERGQCRTVDSASVVRRALGPDSSRRIDR